MRVIGGSRAGRRIDAPVGLGTRPTSDRVREAIFNRLAHGAFVEHGVDGDPFAGAVLDLYAGAGGLGLEALSRGAPSCVFVDSHAAACAAIRRNLTALDLAAAAEVQQASVEAYLKRARGPFVLVFADPPYDDAGRPLSRALARLDSAGLLAPQALVVVEHGDHAVPETPPGLRALDRRRYGQTTVSFFAPSPRGMRSET